jgi:hypothetical protein
MDFARAEEGLAMSVLDEVRASQPDYGHVPNVLHPAPVVEAGGGVLEWYDIAEGDRPIPRDVASSHASASRRRPAEARWRATSGSSS